jgi:hypothetical protein
MTQRNVMQYKYPTLVIIKIIKANPEDIAREKSMSN